MLVAIPCSSFHQFRTARMSACDLRLSWHLYFSMKKGTRRFFPTCSFFFFFAFDLFDVITISDSSSDFVQEIHHLIFPLVFHATSISDSSSSFVQEIHHLKSPPCFGRLLFSFCLSAHRPSHRMAVVLKIFFTLC